MALTKPKLSQNIDTDVSVFSDPILVLHQGSTLANVDVGFLMNRSNGLTSNAAVIWQESSKSFVHILTNSSGVDNSNLAVQSYANVSVGNVLLINNAGIYVDGTLGSSGQVLASDGSKTYWAAPGGFTGGTVLNTTIFNSNVVAASGTDSTNTTTGALVIVGGAGVSGNVVADKLYTASGVYWSGNGLAFTSTTLANTNEITANISSGQNVGLSLTATGVVAGNYGSATSIPTIVVDSKGRISSVTSNAVSTTITLAGGSGSGSVAGGGTLTVNGTANQITTSVAASTITIALAQDITAPGNITVTGNLTVQGNTTTLNTETLTVEDLNITVANGAASSAAADGAGLTVGGANARLLYKSATDSWVFDRGVFASGNLVANSGTTSTSTTTGALVVSGGAGISGALYIANTNDVSANIGAFYTYANTKIGTNSGSNLVVAATTTSTSTTTGALVIAGGAGIAGNVTFGGNLTAAGKLIVNEATNSVPYVMGSGAFHVAGGISIGKDIWVGGNLYVANVISQTSTIIQVNDPLVYLKGNNNPYNYDIGVFSDFTGGSLNNSQYTGAVRSYQTNEWVFFSNIDVAPAAGTVGLNNSKVIYDPIKVGNIVVANTTVSSSTTTGALIVSGGAGIGGALYITNTNDVSANIGTLFNGNISTNANLGAYQTFANANAATQATSINTINANIGAFYTYANTKIGTNTNSNLVVVATTAATSTTTGALVIAGGAGFAGNVYIGSTADQTVLLNSYPEWAANSVRQTTRFTTSTTAPAGPIVGDQWYDSSTDIVYEYINDGTNSIWVDISSAFGNNFTTLSGVTVRATGNAQATSTTTGDLQIVGGASIATGNLYIGGSGGRAITHTGDIIPSANLLYDLGSTTAWYDRFYGQSTQALYADLAENYLADANYSYGTVVCFGGEQEITISTITHDPSVAGVISKNPAHLMNGALSGEFVLPLALQGRVYCQVQGPIAKGDLLVTGNEPGIACRLDKTKFEHGCLIGKSLENISDTSIKLIEVVVGRD